MSWSRILIYYMSVQAIIGAILMEYSMSRTRRFRDADEVRDGRFPWFRRYDAPNWNRVSLYPGALLIMPTKILLLTLDGIFLLLIL